MLMDIFYYSINYAESVEYKESTGFVVFVLSGQDFLEISVFIILKRLIPFS